MSSCVFFLYPSCVGDSSCTWLYERLNGFGSSFQKRRELKPMIYIESDYSRSLRKISMHVHR